MKEKKYFIRLIVLVALFTVHCSLFTSPIRAQVGTWRNYLSYAEPTQIQAAGNDLFVLASGSLYQYNQNDQSIYTYDKVNGMSDVDITHISWCKQAKRLVVVYSNSNIDLVETNGNITNISDLYTKTITGDKTVKSIRIDGIYAYLLCGFGIVKVNVQRAEIAETYTPSNPDYPTSLPAEDNSDYDKYIDIVKTLQPGGPRYNHIGFMTLVNGKLYTCNGTYSDIGNIQVYENNKWKVFSTDGISDVADINHFKVKCIAIDPTSTDEHVFAGSRNGLFEFRNGAFVKYYNCNNSPIEIFDGKSINYQIISGAIFDQTGNLWFLNSSAPTASLIKLSKDGTFTKYNHPEYMKHDGDGYTNKSNPQLGSMMFDSRGILWFSNNDWRRPAYYQYNTTDDTVLACESFPNQDGTLVEVGGGVRWLSEEDNTGMWICTNVGPLLLEKSKYNDSNPVFTQVKVPRNDGTVYADYLLSNIDISSMAIDGGRRKWFGTKGNGVYLISSDNMTQIQHFTTGNSKLLSDNILSIVINPTTGEVFFGTDKGLCSYISDATEPNEEMTKDNVWAYPNPVTPDYRGPITITGLTYDADVKILAANGALIHQGRSNGGTYTWDGCDQQGRRVASGIYMVATATNDGKKGTVCKIAVVN